MVSIAQQKKSDIIIGLTRLEQLDQLDLKSVKYSSGLLLDTTVAGWRCGVGMSSNSKHSGNSSHKRQKGSCMQQIGLSQRLLSPTECSACIHVRWEPLYACGCCLRLLVGTAGVGWPSLHVCGFPTTHSKEETAFELFSHARASQVSLFRWLGSRQKPEVGS